MTKRKAISKRVRFEVLKRDSFTCQYCGKMPPDTILHIDHIKPVSKGGNNGLLNLVTSCVDCNLGKSDVELSDESAVKKQQAQLSELAEKQAQIKLMIDWRESLIESEELLVISVVGVIDSYLSDFERSVSDIGTVSIRKAVKKHGYQKVLDSIEHCYATKENFLDSWSSALNCYSTEQKPSYHYIKGILRNRGFHVNESSFYSGIAHFALTNENYEVMLKSAKSCSGMDGFWEGLEVLL